MNLYGELVMHAAGEYPWCHIYMLMRSAAGYIKCVNFIACLLLYVFVKI